MLIKYSEIYIFYYEKTLAVNVFILSLLMGLFVLTYILKWSVVPRIMWWVTAFISCFSLIYITIISRDMGSTSGEPLKYFFWNNDYSGNKIIEMTGNVIMFIPFGASVRMIIKTKHPLLAVFFIGTVTSMMLEITQYFLKCGYIEIVDLLTNEAGMIIGCLMSAIVIRIIKRAVVKQQI